MYVPRDVEWELAVEREGEAGAGQGRSAGTISKNTRVWVCCALAQNFTYIQGGM